MYIQYEHFIGSSQGIAIVNILFNRNTLQNLFISKQITN